MWFECGPGPVADVKYMNDPCDFIDLIDNPIDAGFRTVEQLTERAALDCNHPASRLFLQTMNHLFKSIKPS